MAQELNERAEFALRWLSESTDEGTDEYGGPRGRARYALALAGPLARHDGKRDRPGYTEGDVKGAANTLKALKRRGLADNDGGGAWLQARWWITEAGHSLVQEMRARRDLDEFNERRDQLNA